MAGLAALAWLVLTDPARFPVDVQRVETEGLLHTDPARVAEALALPAGPGPNIFLIRATDIEERLRDLPAVEGATVRVVLPDRLRVSVEERLPLFIWRAGDTDFLVDGDGVLLDRAGSDAPALPLVVDQRQPLDAGPSQVGQRIDELELTAILRLAALTPELVGSSAQRLALTIEPEEGFVVTAEPDSWRAVFGIYTPNLRPPEIIDRQVQCLRALLQEAETEVVTVHLAVDDERCGTYRPRSTPAMPSETEQPTGTP